MTRILADLPDDDIRWLDRIAEEQGRSRASVLRDAVRAYKAEAEADDDLAWLKDGFGAWKHRTDIGDAVKWQRRERAASTRPWDDDYEEVKAEFPDLFDEEDDRQRQIYLDMIAGKYPEPKSSGGR
ncbi:Ribbon-helix-helix protein, copG family [Tsuneonella dongtanensis]|uniref:Ribbon-helix-helix protein, copG family n=1 Tax=Tsuneonella dongtanensis TaxID=692370 RepID=A0A1B2AGU4_9SPHN|nr:ribbon-helix-helix protein, CopG family [Tsuneonella dongtanensis]ANY21359.1 Ribbon-helix-helix protein, copG family [Tsuneonella dongtanensis]